MPEFRFEVGLSFAGTDRDARVLPIASRLAGLLGQDKVYYDRHFEHELHRRSMDSELGRTYTRDCLMVVVCLSASYLERDWCRREWTAILDWSKGLARSSSDRDELRLAIVRFDETSIAELPGVEGTHGFLDVEARTDAQVVDYLSDRLGLIKGARQLRHGRDGVFPPNPHAPFKSECGATMVPVAASTFMMGSPRPLLFGPPHDEAQHRVRLTRGFHMSSTPITQSQWARVMGMHRNRSEFPGDELPVENVSWDDAQSFCRILTERDSAGALPRAFRYRLPTEAEWEYACRAGSTGRYPWGTALKDGREHANLYDFSGAAKRTLAHKPAPWDDGFAATSPVGRFKPNGFGLFDMIGNVWEWCEDWYAPYNLADTENPRGPGSGTLRVVRGSSWYDDPHLTAHAACRHKLDPVTRSRHVGFRIVAE